MADTRPSRRLLLVWMLYTLLIAAVLIAASLLIARSANAPAWIGQTAAGLFALLFLSAAVYLPLRFRSLLYEWQGDRLTLKSGVFFRTEKTAPLVSIRYISLLCGPVERCCGIGTLLIFTAGGMLFCEGLPLKTARSLQQRLLTAAKMEAQDG